MLRRSIRRLFNTFWPGRADRQLDAFGNAGALLQAREQHRDARAFAWIVDARRDLRYAARTLAAAPGFTGVARTVLGGMPLILARTRAHPVEISKAMRDAVSGADRSIAIRPVLRMSDLLDRGHYAQPRFSLLVLSIFAATGTILVAVGVFS